MPVAETIPVAIEYYKYTGQPHSEWPKWLQIFDSLPDGRDGKIATAHYDTSDGEPEWWRWFEEDVFFRQYRHVTG